MIDPSGFAGDGSSAWLCAALGYLLGSVPFGLLLTSAAGLGDLRRIGSGNIGATNVLRTGSRPLAALTLLLDAGKGAAAVLLAERLAPGSGTLAAMGAFLGHLYPVWLSFRGGKGVAILLGIAVAIQPSAALAFALTWLVVAATSRLSSLAGMTAALATPLAGVAAGRYETSALFTGMALLLILKHRANIGRLLRGEEPRIGGRPQPDPVMRAPSPSPIARGPVAHGRPAVSRSAARALRRAARHNGSHRHG